MKLALWVIFMLTVTIAAAWMMFRQRELIARFVALVLVSIVPFGLTSCDGGWFPPAESPSKRTKFVATEVIAALKDDSQTNFCVVAFTREKKQFGLSKTDPTDRALHHQGKFWVSVPFESGALNGFNSEFYSDAEEAVKALTDRGVVVFRTCREPLPL